MHNWSLFPVLFFVIMVVTGCNGPDPETVGDKDNPILMLDDENPNLVEAKKKASESISEFVDLLQVNKGDTNFFFSVKKHFEIEGLHEHMWVEVEGYNNGMFYGTLGNEPSVLTKMSFGDSLIVHSDDVEDWMVYDQKRDTTIGAFTIKALGREDLLKKPTE